MTKQEEYTHMLNTKPYALITPVKGGKEIKWTQVWDHHRSATQTTFKSLSPPPYEHKLISFQEIDLMPVANKKIYKITIKFT